MKRRLFTQSASALTLSAFLSPLGSCYVEEPVTSLMPDGFIVEELTIGSIHDLVNDGKLNFRGLVNAYLARIEEIDRSGPALNSIIEVNPDAISIAEQLDQDWSEGKKKGLLHGIPVIIKDNIDTHDKMSTTAGSRALIGSKPLQDSGVAKKLRAAGAIILAKANLSEWANFRGEKSSSGWSAHGGLTKNPYILDRNTCGSSAGSGASVSANLCMIAIGTETNGSIVCPSSTNGVVGIKPTVGLISRSGIIPISSTQDTAGPMARTVADAVHCLGVLTGLDDRDEKTVEGAKHALTDYTGSLKSNGLKGKKIAHFTSSRGLHEGVDKLMDQAIVDMKKAGAEIVEIDKISEDHVFADSFNIMLFEYKQGLNDYFASLGPDAHIKNLEELIAFNKSDSLELKYFGQEYLEMAQEKAGLESKEYKETLARMLKGRREDGIDRVMDELQLDAIIAPTGSPAWKTQLDGGDTFVLGSSSPAAQSGYPNITVPMGFSERLPVGISIFGRAWSEPTLIEIAYAYEQATKHRKAPTFLAS